MRWISVATVLLSAACAPQAASPAAPQRADAAALDRAVQTITEEEMRERIGILAHDSLEGRGTPSRGLEKAAAYLAAELERMGLRPAGEGGTYLQRFPLRMNQLDAERTRLRVDGPGGPRPLRFGSDFFAVTTYRDSASGEAVFLGPYARIMDGSVPLEGVAGRVAVIVWPQQGADIRPLRRLEAAGAVGALLVLHPSRTEEFVRSRAAINQQPFPTSAADSVPVLAATRYEVAERIFRTAGVDPALLADTVGPSRPMPLPGTVVHITAPVRRTEHRVPNVVALLPGSDPLLREEYVVLTAHFDHDGIGPPDEHGDSIYNGADDNASGTAAVLEIAEAFASLRAPPARSILFLLVGGEELGLLGSKHFAAHPTIPLERVVANLNLDMIGRNAPDTVIVVGDEFSSLGELARRLAAEHPGLGLTPIGDPYPPEEMGFYRSDNVAFVRHDIPAIAFFSGLHDDYHTPHDEVERIDAEKAARIARLAFLTAHAVANAPERPTWTPGSLEQVREVLKTWRW